MATTQNVFTGNTNPAIVTQTSIFTGAGAIYLTYTGASGLGYEMDSYLQIFVEPTQSRNISWILERDTLTTVNILSIPAEYLGFPMRLDMFASESIPIKVDILLAECSCQVELDAIDTKVNILLAKELISTATQIIGLVISGGVSQILPAILPGAIREAIKIFNPSVENILIGLGRVPTPTSFDDIIPAFSFYDEDEPFKGVINAITQSGNPVTLNVTTLP